MLIVVTALAPLKNGLSDSESKNTNKAAYQCMPKSTATVFFQSHRCLVSNAILSCNSFEPDSGQTGENKRNNGDAPMLVSQTTVVADMASREARLGLKPVYAVGDCHLRGPPLCKRARTHALHRHNLELVQQH